MSRLFFLAVVLLGVALFLGSPSPASDSHVDVHVVEGIINPVVVEYISQSIDQAEADNAGVVVFQLDTPGGLVESTRLIVKA
ncbi:MAG: nodulation protein NfeD, partial [Candidatus Tectomicrobia bacterium]|nr:nodulation protein NfeD [Candidatus Tectomicrobia bacterium]